MLCNKLPGHFKIVVQTTLLLSLTFVDGIIILDFVIVRDNLVLLGFLLKMSE